MKSVDFYFDYRSPYSYLALTQLRNTVADIRFFPFDIRLAMQLCGNVPTSVTCRAKSRYIKADLERWAQSYGVPLLRHPQRDEIDSRRLLRATLIFSGDDRKAVADALFHALWVEPRDVGSAAGLAALIREAGVNLPDLEGAIDSDENDARLNQATSDAVERGVFGAPSFFVGEDMFFGNDRLAFVMKAMEAA